MKIINFAVKIFNTVGAICAPITFVLAILWFLQPEKNYEPITVALASLSVISIAIAQILQRKYTSKENKETKLEELTIDEILEVVADSSPDDWNVSFDDDAEIAVFKTNSSLRIETRHTDEFVHNDDFYEKWANKFPDPHARSYYYHVYFGATRLRKIIFVSVDGGRALLPLPNYAMDLSVKPIRYKIALIFDRFDSCDKYMKRAGLHLAKQN